MLWIAGITFLLWPLLYILLQLHGTIMTLTPKKKKKTRKKNQEKKTGKQKPKPKSEKNLNYTQLKSSKKKWQKLKRNIMQAYIESECIEMKQRVFLPFSRHLLRV